MLDRKNGFIFTLALLGFFYIAVASAQDVFGFNQASGSTSGGAAATGMTSSNSLTATDFKAQVTSLNQTVTTTLTTLVYQQMPKLLASRTATPSSSSQPTTPTPAPGQAAPQPSAPAQAAPSAPYTGFGGTGQQRANPPARGRSGSGGFNVNY